MATHEVVRLVSAQREQAIDVLTKAFRNDAGYRYVIPDPDERVRSLDRFWDALLTHCGICGEVYTTMDVRGVACWLSPGNASPTFWQLLRTRFALPRAVMGFSKEARDRLAPLMRYNDEVHHRTVVAPHWYLGALAVDPDYQHTGVGSALLQPVLARADASRTPCYLETQTRGNAQFYEKQGFKVVNEGEVAGTGLTMWGMLREPRSTPGRTT